MFNPVYFFIRKTNPGAEWGRVEMWNYKPDEKEQIRRNALWNAFGNLVYLGLQWLITIFVVRIGGYADAGYLSLAMSITGTLQNFSHFGIRNYQVSDIESKFSDRDYISVRIWTCLGSYIFCIGILLLNRYSGVQAMSILCFMLFRLVESFSDVLHGIAQKNQRLDIAGKSFLLRGMIGFLSFCITYWITKNLWLGLLLMSILTGLCVLGYDVRTIWKLPWEKREWNRKRAVKILQECFPLCLYLFCSAAIITLPRVFLEKQFGNEKLGIYAAVFAPALLLQAGAGYLFLPFLPTFAKDHYQGRGKEFLYRFYQLSAIIGVSFVLIFSLSKLFGAQILQLVLGTQILGYEYLLDGVLICTFMTAYTSFLCALLTVLRKFQILLVGNIAALICCYIISPLFLKKFGIKGASDTLIVSLFLLIILLLPTIWKEERKK